MARKYRTPSDFVTQYLRRHSFQQLDELAERLYDEDPQLALYLATKIANAAGMAMGPILRSVPEPEEIVAEAAEA